jgi:hypothetical protein
VTASTTMESPTAATDPQPCEHMNFDILAEVNRLVDTEESPPRAFYVDLKVWCQDCSEPFVWMGLPAGLSPAHPTVSVNGFEMRAPVRPGSSASDFGLGGPGFSVAVLVPGPEEVDTA